MLACILHYFLVLRTKYIFESDLSRYAKEYSEFYEKDMVLSPLLSKKVWVLLFLLAYLILVLFSIDIPLVSNKILGLFFLGITLIMVMDLFYEFLRFYTNKRSKNRIKIPISLSQVRFLGGVVEVVVKTQPLCLKIAGSLLSVLGATEFFLPLALGGPNNIGPATNIAANAYYSSHNMPVPIRTRLDIVYEHAYGIDQKNFLNDSAYRPLPQRTESFFSAIQMAKHGNTDHQSVMLTDMASSIYRK
jgi:hypothetical protein